MSYCPPVPVGTIHDDCLVDRCDACVEGMRTVWGEERICYRCHGSGRVHRPWERDADGLPLRPAKGCEC